MSKRSVSDASPATPEACATKKRKMTEAAPLGTTWLPFGVDRNEAEELAFSTTGRLGAELIGLKKELELARREAKQAAQVNAKREAKLKASASKHKRNMEKMTSQRDEARTQRDAAIADKNALSGSWRTKSQSKCMRWLPSATRQERTATL